MRSYLNTKKKKKLIKILHLLPSNFRTKHFFIKRIIYDLFEIVSLSRHRGRIDRRRKAYEHAQWGARCPFELVCARCACLSAQLTPRISHCEGDRASRVVATRRSDRPIIIQRMALWYILIYRFDPNR